MNRPASLLAVTSILLPPNFPAQQLAAPGLATPLTSVTTEDSTGNAAPLWIRPVASGLVPGSGQILAGHDRAAIYLLTEAFLAIRFFSDRAEGRRERDRYLDLAFRVARGSFSPVMRDTAFEYFEQMEKFVESGPFDADPGPAFAPPMDGNSFNGSIWALARQTFFANPDEPPDPQSPEYQRALDFYRERAVGPNFQWSWRNAGLEQDLFVQSIRGSDEALRRARQQLGLLLANHLLSAVDAFVSNRFSGRARDLRIETMISMPGAGGAELRARIGLRIGI